MVARYLWLSLSPLLRREEGQDLAEYALLMGLIAVVAIVAVTAVGPIIGEQFNTITEQLAAVL